MKHRAAATLIALGGVLLTAACGRTPPGDSAARDTAMTRDSSTNPLHRVDSSATETDSGLAILSPTPGAVLTEGSSYTIRWRAPRGMRVSVGAAMGGKDKGHLAIDLPAGTDSLNWTVPKGFVSSFGPDHSDAVYLRIENATNPAQYADSNPFTVRAAPPGS